VKRYIGAHVPTVFPTEYARAKAHRFSRVEVWNRVGTWARAERHRRGERHGISSTPALDAAVQDNHDVGDTRHGDA
jgi:hypothetical protein